jgi:hypothetical protein
MPEDAYWVRLHHGERLLGVAFLLTRRYLLTAEHCLREVSDAEIGLLVEFADGSMNVVHVHERLKDADLALLRLVGAAPVEPLSSDRCEADDRWRVPSRPSMTDPLLRGVVDEADVAYECEGGDVLEALQLRTDVELGDYSGYSGGPVERDHAVKRTLAGVLLEQYPDRQHPARASSTLFAATIAEVMRRFDCFDLSNVAKVMSGPARKTSVEDVLTEATAVLETAAKWQAQDLMSPAEVSALRLRVARSVVDQTVARRRT